ncbi:exodeoxyribonuclease III [Aureimonas sp. AU22]|uniref:exodeoxyribonuclease III n=1 Tax=Aureimonas sp. AU22 TaxID=1638162 RepID=UPI0007824DB8|nr:exodeoxyribonuclease III [Aureimonas sp. AU22]
MTSSDRLVLTSWNVNGLRSVVRRDFETWLTSTRPDVVCLQEVKTEADLLTRHWFPGYVAHWNGSQRPGYGGVATLVRENLRADEFMVGIADPVSDPEGRVLTMDVEGLRIVNVYAPHSHRKLLRLEAKMQFLEALSRHVAFCRRDGIPIVVMGDMNIAHQKIDLANPKANERNAGYRPEERAWLDGFLADGFVDAFRYGTSDGGHYTWWSMRAGVRDRNIGWRIDYALVERSIVDRVVECRHLPDRAGSDHCPVRLVVST